MFMICSWCCVFYDFFSVFFFFKQKTAYEMRISDWSSDVCSSDLHSRTGSCRQRWRGCGASWAPAMKLIGGSYACCQPCSIMEWTRWKRPCVRHCWQASPATTSSSTSCHAIVSRHGRWRLPHPRSEEHTSELQSLMRISYAVFCLKKKKKN